MQQAVKMVQTTKYDLFISYADADRGWVKGYLLDALKQAGICYHSEAAFALGTVRLFEFERAIQQSRRTLLVLSPAYIADCSEQFIVSLAQCYGLDTATWPVIPLILHPVELPPRLSVLVKLNATNPDEWEEAVARLCADVHRPVPDSLPQPTCPYPGMVPFSEDMSDRFFGRDKEVKELIERLRLHPFIAVIGPSGSGKSSLVFAGLLPVLRRSRLFGSGEWQVRTMRPGEIPLTALETALGGDPTNPGLAVTEVLATQPGTQRLLLVVDQFEELFTLALQETVSFQSALLRLVETPNCYLILTVRADFYPDLMSSPLWRQIQSHRLEIVPLDAVGLREAIVRPAEDVGVFVESALVERLVTDAAGEPGVLPLIQETLVLMWEQVQRRFLPLRAYEALVLPRKAYGALGSQKLTGLQVALARRADAALASLSEAQQAIARRIFLRLIQFGEGRADTRRQQSINALITAYDDKSLFKQTLHHLANSHLLTLSGEEGSNTTVDMAHEALISGWPKLQQWISERREAEQTRRRLTAQATEWVRLGQGSGGLLDEVELAEAQGWLSSPDAAALGYDEVLPALVEASGRVIQEAKRREEEVRQRDLEQERQLRELAESRQTEAEARAGAEAARAQEAETRVRVQKQRTRIVLVAGCLLTLLAAIAVGFWIKAEQRKETAINALISEPQRLLETDNQLEALIASVKALKQLKEIGGSNTHALNKLKSVIEQVRERNRLEGHQAPVVGASFSPDGKTIASGSADKTIKLWSISGKLLKTLPDTDQVWGVEFSPDGTMLASASNDKTVKLWSAQGKPLRTLRGHEDIVVAVSFSPDSKTLASSGYDGTIRIWDTANGKLLRTIKDLDVIKDRGVIYSIDYSPDGKTIASTGYYDGNVKIWNINGKLLKIIKSPQQQKNSNPDQKIVSSVKFSPDGQILAWGSYDGIIKLWRVKEGKFIKTIAAHQDQIYGIAFSPHSEMIASASRDKTVKLWKLDGTMLATLRGHTQAANQVSFRPKTNKSNDQLIASTSDDNTVRLWEFGFNIGGIPELDKLLENSCHALDSYLTTNKNVSPENRHVCDGY
ncbi:MAG: TIR domain-containing protein [Chroococcidiopsidaceae cyanobacterium CP_BM_ER_R8_30]|nr:TIR domain-containing protein [Chroococcidiopsidaceae cyanobacterium CP_BM_ER_R8_30]